MASVGSSGAALGQRFVRVEDDHHSDSDEEKGHKGHGRVHSAAWAVRWREVFGAITRERDARKLLIVIVLNTLCAVSGLTWGLLHHQQAVLSDVLYMLFDSLAFSLSLASMLQSKAPPTATFSYGFERAEVMAGFFNAALLLFYGTTNAVHTVQKAFESNWDAHDHEGGGLFWLAVFMLVVNAVGMLSFRVHSTRPLELRRGRDENLHVIYLHLFFNGLDGATYIFISITSQYRAVHAVLKPGMAALSSVLVIASAVGPFMRTGGIILQTTPDTSVAMLNMCLREASHVEGVVDCSSTHFWQYSPGYLVGSMCIRVRPDSDEHIILHRIHKIFGGKVKDLTIEVKKE